MERFATFFATVFATLLLCRSLLLRRYLSGLSRLSRLLPRVLQHPFSHLLSLHPQPLHSLRKLAAAHPQPPQVSSVMRSHLSTAAVSAARPRPLSCANPSRSPALSLPPALSPAFSPAFSRVSLNTGLNLEAARRAPVRSTTAHPASSWSVRLIQSAA